MAKGTLELGLGAWSPRGEEVGRASETEGTACVEGAQRRVFPIAKGRQENLLYIQQRY